MKTCVCALLLLLPVVNSLMAQEDIFPDNKAQIGQSLSGLKFSKVLNYSKTELSMDDLRGKWVILDFWGLGCTTCIKKMPELNELQKRFSNKLQILPVGSSSEQTQLYFKKLIAKNHWILPSLFDDSLFTRYKVRGVPYEVWIDDKGIIQAFTGGDVLTSENLEAFIKGNKISYSGSNVTVPVKNIRTSNNARSTLGDSVFFFRSTLTPFNNAGGGTSRTMDSTRFMYCTSVLNMYQITYQPYFSNSRIIVSSKDSNKISDHLNEKYCYELFIPPFRKKDAGEFILQDLERYFGYRAKIEIRETAVLDLVRTDTINIKTKGGEILDDCTAAGLHLINQPFSYLIDRLDYYLGEKIPLVDKTQYEGQIDIDLDANMLDREDVIRALNRYGLNIEIRKEKIPMLVIYDPKEQD
jgi:thiol-disulfide isomerase/thioredoxin